MFSLWCFVRLLDTKPLSIIHCIFRGSEQHQHVALYISLCLCVSAKMIYQTYSCNTVKPFIGASVLCTTKIDDFRRQPQKYQPSGAGGTRSPPATPHRLPVGLKMADGVWKTPT